VNMRIAILTISDRSAKGEREDLSGPALAAEISNANWLVVEKGIVPDDVQKISQALVNWCDQGTADIILTTGGTGFSPRDVTPEATLAVIERMAPGIAEAMRMESLKITPHAMLSRGVAGIRGRTLITNLPGSPKGAVENLRTIMPVLPHAVDLLREEPTAEAGHKKAS
jgi:molybdopterin adenylyltransferase